MPNYTTNLNLEKPLGDEQYNIEVFNANADKIDQFAGQTPPYALTANSLTTGAKINGVNFKGDTDVVTGLGLYSDSVTYSSTNIVFKIIDDNVKIYKSKQNDNINHDPETSSDYWEEVELGGSGEIGDIIWRLLPSQDAGKHLLDGALLQGTGATEDFVDYIADLYADNPNANYFTDEGTWQTTVMIYGACGKFVYDDVNNTVRLPKVTGIVEGTIDATALGELIEAGLPNITGDKSGRIIGDTATWSGAFSSSSINSNANVAGGSGVLVNNGLYFDASLSDSTYGNLATGAKNKVQPQTIKGYYYIVIANTKKTNYTINIDNVMTDLYGKMDVDGTNANSSVKNFDGAYVDTYQDLSTSVALGTYTIDVSPLLPNDGYDYEVLINLYQASLGTTITATYIFSDIANTQLHQATAITSQVTVDATQIFWLPVGSAREVYKNIYGVQPDVCSLKMCGYRRIGTNQ